jgi:hypothetical protein
MILLWFWFASLLEIKTWKKPEIKSLIPITEKQTTRGQSNLTGTRTEERLIVTEEKSPAMDEECDCSFLIYCAAKSI